MSHDGGAWTVTLTEDLRKCWAFAETMEAQPWRIPREQWQIFNGKDWTAAPAAFAVTEAQPLPAGWERRVSRSTRQVYYFNTKVRTSDRLQRGLVFRVPRGLSGLARSSATALNSRLLQLQTGESQWELPGSGDANRASGGSASAGHSEDFTSGTDREQEVRAALAKVKERLQTERRRREQVRAISTDRA